MDVWRRSYRGRGSRSTTRRTRRPCPSLRRRHARDRRRRGRAGHARPLRGSPRARASRRSSTCSTRTSSLGGGMSNVATPTRRSWSAARLRLLDRSRRGSSRRSTAIRAASRRRLAVAAADDRVIGCRIGELSSALRARPVGPNFSSAVVSPSAEAAMPQAASSSRQRRAVPTQRAVRRVRASKRRDAIIRGRMRREKCVERRGFFRAVRARPRGTTRASGSHPAFRRIRVPSRSATSSSSREKLRKTLPVSAFAAMPDVTAPPVLPSSALSSSSPTPATIAVEACCAGCRSTTCATS